MQRLHKGEPDDPYSSPNVFRTTKSGRMRWAGYVERVRDGRGACRALMGRPKGNKQFGRPRRRWDDYIKMNLQEVR